MAATTINAPKTTNTNKKLITKKWPRKGEKFFRYLIISIFPPLFVSPCWWSLRTPRWTCRSPAPGNRRAGWSCCRGSGSRSSQRTSARWPGTRGGAQRGGKGNSFSFCQVLFSTFWTLWVGGFSPLDNYIFSRRLHAPPFDQVWASTSATATEKTQKFFFLGCQWPSVRPSLTHNRPLRRRRRPPPMGH